LEWYIIFLSRPALVAFFYMDFFCYNAALWEHSNCPFVSSIILISNSILFGNFKLIISYYLIYHKARIICNVDIDASTVNSGETTDEKGSHKLNVHVSFERDPNFSLNPRCSISQGSGCWI